MPYLNGQINALNGGGTYNQNYFIEKYSLNASESDLTETVVVKFSTDSPLPGGITSPADPALYEPTPALYEPTRVAKNYDVSLAMSPFSPAFVEGAEFSIEFENSVHYFVNNSGFATFLIKSYNVDQKFSIVGGEAEVQNIFNVTAGNFQTITPQITLAIRNRVFYSYSLPLVVKSRTDKYNNDNLIKVDLGLSIYGATVSSPTNTIFSI
jgi:hypothetical protein